MTLEQWSHQKGFPQGFKGSIKIKQEEEEEEGKGAF